MIKLTKEVQKLSKRSADGREGMVDIVYRNVPTGDHLLGLADRVQDAVKAAGLLQGDKDFRLNMDRHHGEYGFDVIVEQSRQKEAEHVIDGLLADLSFG